MPDQSPPIGYRQLLLTGLALAALVGIVSLGLWVLLDTGPPASRAVRPVPSGELPPVLAPRPDGLGLGITESNAEILSLPRAGSVFERWQHEISALRPRIYRLPIVWGPMQPDPSHPLDLTLAADGCLRGQPPCGAFSGLRDELRALAERRRAGERFEVMAVPYWVPDWAAGPAGGCERSVVRPGSRPITDAGLVGYRHLIAAVVELATQEGVPIHFWSPWVEPNGAYFISPQRARCAEDAASRSIDTYVRLARAMRAVLDEVPGDQQIVVAEMAGTTRSTPRSLAADEFLRALPDDVVCRAAAISTHAYVDMDPGASPPPDPVAAVEVAMDERPCLRDRVLWVTETGVGGPRAGQQRDVSPAGLMAQCRVYAERLRDWWSDPRVTVAIQYTLREDTHFPTGLADAGLTRSYPTLAMLRAFTQSGAPDPAACA